MCARMCTCSVRTRSYVPVCTRTCVCVYVYEGVVYVHYDTLLRVDVPRRGGDDILYEGVRP